ncbi:MAG TPA: succinate dehydrogenase cytochrome b subunit [Blastocatellia bacterium]|nr:succinate dehydrogenase cytochrome b subunit [Blastocatellia bacterium]
MSANIPVRSEYSRPASVNLLVRLFRSSLGRKYVVAVTGFLLFGFIVFHLLGNLQIFLGLDAINTYAHFLQSIPELLWPARILLLLAVILHIVTSVKLWQENRAARPAKYGTGKPPAAASLAARTIIISGAVIFAFIVFHLMHFTLGLVDANFPRYTDYQGRHDVHQMVIDGFANPFISVFYIVAMGLVCLHLSHGVSSIFQSLGVGHRAAFDKLAKAAALVIFIGNCAIVIAAWAGLIK